MLLDRLCKTLEKCNNEVVTVNIEGGITVLYCIEKFEFSEGQRAICFGEYECENFPFIIYKNTISNIEFLDDNYVHVVFDVVNDGLTTRLWICCDDAEVSADE
jgi:hypothetical protein